MMNTMIMSILTLIFVSSSCFGMDLPEDERSAIVHNTKDYRRKRTDLLVDRSGYLPQSFEYGNAGGVGDSREEYSDENFRCVISEALEKFFREHIESGQDSNETWPKFKKQLSQDYSALDFEQIENTFHLYYQLQQVLKEEKEKQYVSNFM